MSLLFTESWMAYPRWTGGVGLTTQDNTNRVNYMANNSVLGLTHYMSQGTSPQVIPAVVADPLNPDRNVLYPNAQSNASGAGSAAFKLQLDLDGSKALVAGFSVYMTAAAMANSPTAVAVEVFMGSYAAVRALVITRDGRFLDHALVAQSSKKLIADTQGFIELRYYKNDLRVWFDDVLVLQKAGVLTLDYFELRLNYVLAGNMTTTFYIGNFYALLEDAAVPNVRLGPTTRVIGRRPASDTQAQWIRTSGPSNASVAAQDPSASPTSLLQTDTVGAADFYAPVTDATTQGATLIHSVLTRAAVGNIDPVGHAFDAGVRVGTDVDYGDNFAASGFQKYSQPWAVNKDIRCILGRANGRILIGGYGPMLYVLKASGTGTLGWAPSVFEGASGTVYFTSIVENSVGRLFALQSDGVLYTCAPGADETVAANWTLKTSPGTATWREMIVGANDYLVAVRTNTGFTFRSIDDGQNWVAGNQPTTRTNCGLCYANGQYVMVSTNATAATTYTSPDGLNWTARVFTASGWANTYDLQSVAYGNGVYVGVGGVSTTAGDLYIIYSSDGITWTRTTVPQRFPGTTTTVASVLWRIIFVDGRFITVGASATAMWSTDGITWEKFLVPDVAGGTLMAGLGPTADGYAVGATDGKFRRFTKNGEKTLVEALTNKCIVRSIPLNPQTHVAWNGSEAAVAEFGMKLTT